MMRTIVKLGLLGWLLMGCAPTAVPPAPPTATPRPLATVQQASSAPSTHTPHPPATPTPLPTSVVPTATPSPTPTPTPICTDRQPHPDDLYAVVTAQYGLSAQFEPPDLVPLSDYFEVDVTKGYPSEVRAILVEPLQRLIADMQAEELQPQIISGYRSFSAQRLAYEKWLTREPERAALLSARPGHSEHQLGTTVDFSSPTLYQYVEGADETLEFHTYFYQTPEGAWLAERAHEYGFTLSYPPGARVVTGFYYEPWHYRYVGEEMAQFLYEKGVSLTEHQLSQAPLPCGETP